MRPRHAAVADRNMLFVGAAGVCGALVLLVLIFAGAKGRVKQSKGAPEISPELLGTELPDRDPASRVQIGQNRAASGDPLQSLQTGRGELEFTNDEGLLAFRYRWDRSDPLETGWNRFTKPQAWIYRSSTQLIQLRSDEGMFRLAENRQPQAGVLQGDVVVSLFESAEPGGVYLIDPATALPVAQFETASLNFDAVQLSGRTDDRVVVRTPDVIIVGNGMNLLFNEQLGRIEKLEIHDRELIAYRQQARTMIDPIAGRETPPSSGGTGGGNGSPAAPANTASSESPTWQGATPYYLTLTEEVIITQGEGDELLTIQGRDLIAEFALRRGEMTGRLSGAPSSRAPDPQRHPLARVTPTLLTRPSTSRWTQLASMALAMTPSPVTFLGSDLGPGNEDIRITGAGSLLLVPIDGTAVHLADPDDLYATLDGDPVRVNHGEFYAIGADIEYSRSQAVARLRCNRDQPIEAGLPGGARLTSVVPFEYQFDEHTGTLQGAGTLVGLVPKPADPQPPLAQPIPNASAMKGLPEGFSVNWLDDFTVEFSGTDQGGGLGKIAAAVFNGTVHVDDPGGYSLDSEQLRIDFKDKSNAKEQLVDTITATGDAVLRSAQGNVSGDELFVLFQENAAGASYPAQMTVTGHGRVVDAGGSIAAQYIQADLVEQSMASEQALPARFGGSSTFAVSELLAQGSVVLSFEDGVTAMADRLDADARTDTAVLTGEHVIVSDPSLKVMGRHAEITNISSTTADRVARFIGPGTLTYLEMSPSSPPDDGKTDRARPVTTPQDMRDELRRRLEEQPSSEPESLGTPNAESAKVGSVQVQWADRLTFEERAGRITFEGDVVAASEPSPREVDTLTGSWMQIELTDPIPMPTDDETRSTRRLRKMTMLGGREQAAQIEAQRFADDEHLQRELLLAVASEIIEYTESTELFEALGEGWMVVVDSRPKEDGGEAGAREPATAAVQFSGPGETEFVWNGRLSLQGGPGLLTISDRVVMRHRPEGESVMRVDCDTMTASLRSSETVSALDLSKSQGMELTSAVAEGAVYVRREDRSIWADQLTYDRKTLLATIESFDDNFVVMESSSTGGAVQARRILWDFFTNGITVEGARVDGPMPAIDTRR